MPETRTFDPEPTDPVQAAIRAALGETVRPRTPGAEGAPAPKPKPKPPTITTVGSFTFGAAPKPAAQAEPEASEEG